MNNASSFINNENFYALILVSISDLLALGQIPEVKLASQIEIIF